MQWCKAFGLYQKLVVRQNTSGRIEPPLPSKVMTKPYLLPPQIDDVFKDLYKNYSGNIPNKKTPDEVSTIPNLKNMFLFNMTLRLRTSSDQR